MRNGRVTVTIMDQDDNDLPDGLNFTAAIPARGTTSGTLRIILSHFDEELKDGTDQSDETDIDAILPVNIQ